MWKSLFGKSQKPVKAPFDSEPVIRVDQIMRTVKIGNQEWMVENLNINIFRNGDTVPEAKTDEEWEESGKEHKPAWCYYGNAPDNGRLYGKLYNWYAVNDPRGLAPEGWHIPTDEDWKQLSTNIGLSLSDADETGWRGRNEGGKLKESGTVHWISPNIGATNESGFCALPGGYRGYGGGVEFIDIGCVAYFWSSTECYGATAWLRSLAHNQARMFRYHHFKKAGYSVRLIRDN